MTKWITQPISETCEAIVGTNPAVRHCGQPTRFAYKAMGHGWMAMCGHHAAKHLDYSEPIETLLAKGETLKYEHD